MQRDEPTGTQTLTAASQLVQKKAERIAGRYEVREKLGAGGMSTVYLAHDHKNATDIAIKFMKTDLGGSARRRFFREFNTIAGIQHPCCLRVYEIGETVDAPYFTMELHPGKPVTSVLGDPPAGSKEQGKLSCKLADFGLAKFYQLDSSLTNERGLVGTPAYCAPEQIDGLEIDHRVDLYAVGVLAFELLSGGRHPFALARNQGMHALLHAQLSTPAPRLRDVNPHIAEELSEIVNSYLAKEPDLRPASALPLRRALCELYGIEVDERLAELSSPSEVVLNALGFVCRESELRQVDQFLHARSAAAASQRNPTVVSKPILLFSGEPGAGKTSTMQEAVRRAIGLGFQEFEGRCLEGSTSAFQPVVEIIRQILSSAARAQRSVDESTLLSDFQATLTDLQRMQAVIEQYRTELLLVAPELRRWLGGETQTPTFHPDADYIFRALTSLLLELSQVTPLCLCFDDIQWSDNSTLTLLRHVAVACQNQHENSDSKPPVLAILCNGRSGYPLLQSFIAKLESQSLINHVELQALGLDETRELLALRLGCLPSSVTIELTEAIHLLCQGSPFFVSETIREWHTRGMVVRTTDGWQRVHTTIDDESSLPSTVRSALRNRISDLSLAARQLVPYAAMIGRIVDLDLLSNVCPELSDAEMLDAVDELISKRVFVETNQASRVAFSHDLLRETIQADVSANRSRSMHRKIAEVLEDERAAESKHVQPAVLARHYLAGEMTSKAFECLLDAAERALQAFAFDDALEFLKQAKSITPEDASQDAQFRLHYMLSKIAANTGNVEAAFAEGELAVSLAPSPIYKADALCCIARVAGVNMHMQELYERALDTLGMSRFKAPWQQLLAISYNVFAFHLMPRPLLAILNRSRANSEKQSAACRVMFQYAHTLAARDLLTYVQICTSMVRIARTLDDSTAKAAAYAKYGVNLALWGLLSATVLPGGTRFLALRYAHMGLEIAKRGGRGDLIGSTQATMGFCVYCAGELAEAEALLLEADTELRHSRELHSCYVVHFLRHVYSIQGESSKVIREGARELEFAKITGDIELQAWAYYGLTHGYALAGQQELALDAASESIRLASGNHSGFLTISYLEQGFAFMQSSRYSEAVAAFRTAITVMHKYKMYFEICSPVYPRIVEALLGPKWHVGKEAEGCDVRSARKFARMARLFSLSFPNIRPHTWRTLGRLNYALGKHAKASKCFERAIEAADKIGAKYDRARALIDSGIANPALAVRKQQGLRELEALSAVMPQAEMAAATD